MRYYSYNEYDPAGPIVVTKSEEEIVKEYHSFWYGEMCDKFGKDHVDATYAVEDCIQDWIIVHWAWEVKQDE